MADNEQIVAILFADICGSTALFEATGNIEGLKRVGECLDELSGIAREHGGHIIRSKGDDLLCTFESPDDSFASATRMASYEFEFGLQIHVGMHFGSVISARGDIFGDAVNVAARMLSVANPGEIVVTEDLRAAISPVDRRMLRLLEKRVVKGKAEPIKVYTVAPMDGEATQFYMDGGRHTIVGEGLLKEDDHEFRVVLSYQGGEIVCGERDPQVTLGRSSSCDLVISESWVSREHATVAVSQGRAVLTDRSSTGTYISSNGEHPVIVRRETVPLLGNGVISLGRSPEAENPNLIEFRQSKRT